MDIKDMLKNFDKNLINEDVANSITEAFDKAVNEKVQTKTKNQVSLTVEKALMEQDEDHANKLKAILEKSDADHVQKLKLVVKTITENHTKKLGSIVNFYKKSIDQKANTFSEKVVNDLDKFLSKYLEKKIPYNQITEAVKNTHARKQLDAIRKMVSFDPSLVNESVRTVVKEGKSTVDSLTVKLNESIEENAKLSRQLNKYQSALLLEGKTRGMHRSKKDYVVKILEDKDVNYIKENFNYVVEMFENGESDESKRLGKDAKENTAISRNSNVTQVIRESKEDIESDAPNGRVGEYLSELNRIG